MHRCVHAQMDCMFPMNYFAKLVLRTSLPLGVYVLLLAAAAPFRRLKMPWQSDALIDFIFFIIFLIYP